MDERMKFLKKDSNLDKPPAIKSQKVCNKLPQIAATLAQVLPNVPRNLLDILNNYRCIWCSTFIPTLKYAVSHYNMDNHQKFLKLNGHDVGHFKLPFTQAQIQDLETGVLIYANGSNKVQLVDPILKTKEEIRVPESVDKLNVEYCSICCIPFTSSVMALKHYGGKKHKQRLFAKLTAPSDPRDIRDSEFRCNICNVSTSSEDSLKAHLDGKPHLKKLNKVIEDNNIRNTPPDCVSKWGVFDYNCDPDDSYQPFGIPAPFFDCKLEHHPPHIRLDGPWDCQRLKAEPYVMCIESRIGKDRFVSIPEDVLRHYLETVYK